MNGLLSEWGQPYLLHYLAFPVPFAVKLLEVLQHKLVPLLGNLFAGCGVHFIL